MVTSFSLKMKTKKSPLVDTSTATKTWKTQLHKANISNIIIFNTQDVSKFHGTKPPWPFHFHWKWNPRILLSLIPAQPIIFWKRKEHKTNVSYFKQKVDRLVQSILPFTGCPSGKEPSLRDEFCLLNHAAAFTYKIPVNVKATSMILKLKCIVIWRYGMIVTMVKPFRESHLF